MPLWVFLGVICWIWLILPCLAGELAFWEQVMGDFTQGKMAELPNRRPSCQPLCCIYNQKQSAQLSSMTEVHGGLKWIR